MHAMAYYARGHHVHVVSMLRATIIFVPRGCSPSPSLLGPFGLLDIGVCKFSILGEIIGLVDVGRLETVCGT